MGFWFLRNCLQRHRYVCLISSSFVLPYTLLFSLQCLWRHPGEPCECLDSRGISAKEVQSLRVRPQWAERVLDDVSASLHFAVCLWKKTADLSLNWSNRLKNIIIETKIINFLMFSVILGQHFYKLIVYNNGSCPSLTLASFEPETQKTTTALLGLKMVSDPKMFCNLNSTSAAVLDMRSSSTLPTGRKIFSC